ncbi:FadR/GntR family transcriptional regulator [Mitsuokella sp.]|uniref:FadR/GntR family transcriptional regulator n=1 Tax=Mitsuokella TaxID=52225 RepID=UPI0029E18428|nr:GntR family transcriptional regulator [Mitsuokella sp.]MDD6381981.1 GntR family transcriptional regulator [Selenomonadaceae bacterium]MDY4475509.1 GntR family transcriptional regulator [Mitsuokella sp.]
MKEKFLKPISTKSVVQQVIDRLTDAMLHKELRPGDKIPTEMELSESFGIGRNSVREAIKILVSYGVLEIRRPEGTFVTKGFSNKMIDPLLYGLILDDSASMESLKELRHWVDVAIFYHASRKATPEDIEYIEACFKDLAAALEKGDVDAIYQGDNAFHEALAMAAHNELFAKIAEVARILISEIRLRTIKNMVKMGKAQEMYQVHKSIFETIKQHSMGSDLVGVSQMMEDGYFYQYDVLKE